MKNRIFCAAAMCLLAAAAPAQQAARTAPSPEEAAPPAWAFSASAFAYFIPHESDYGAMTVTADRGRLHLEGRYNYEALDTASLWLGTTFEFGQNLTVEVTPMLGGVFGHTNGVTPGYHLTLGYKRLELYSEGEYLFDTGHHSDSFFYNWNELTYSPVEWLRAGLVSQRTRAYRTSLDIQRGLLIGASLKNWKLTVYLFNLGWTDPTAVFSISLDF